MKKSKSQNVLRLISSPKIGLDPGATQSAAPRIARIAVAIMAAGKGTRLKSQIPKVLHEVGGKPLLEHVIRAAARIVPAKDVYAIIGHEADRVRDGDGSTPASISSCRPSSAEPGMR